MTTTKSNETIHHIVSPSKSPNWSAKSSTLPPPSSMRSASITTSSAGSPMSSIMWFVNLDWPTNLVAAILCTIFILTSIALVWLRLELRRRRRQEEALIEDREQTDAYRRSGKNRMKLLRKRSSRFSIDLDRFVADISGFDEKIIQIADSKGGPKRASTSAPTLSCASSSSSLPETPVGVDDPWHQFPSTTCKSAPIGKNLNPLAVSIANLVSKTLNDHSHSASLASPPFSPPSLSSPSKCTQSPPSSPPFYLSGFPTCASANNNNNNNLEKFATALSSSPPKSSQMLFNFHANDASAANNNNNNNNADNNNIKIMASLKQSSLPLLLSTSPPVSSGKQLAGIKLNPVDESEEDGENGAKKDEKEKENNEDDADGHVLNDANDDETILYDRKTSCGSAEISGICSKL